MKHYGIKIAAVLALSAMIVPRASAEIQREERTYDGIKAIRISTVSGDCIVMKGSGTQTKVEVEWNYRPRDSFEPRFSDRGGVLRLEEDIYDSNSGRSTWTLTVPDGVEVEFNTASGNLEATGLALDELSGETASGDLRIENCQGEFRLSTASGNIDATSCRGRLEASVASGDIRLIDCTGEFELSAASGDVESEGTTVEGPSSFSTASGSVEVVLAQPLKHDLTLSTASGDVELNLNGTPPVGYFELTARYRGGRIESPYEFDDEEQFREHGEKYIRKWFNKGGDKPEVIIRTYSGDASLADR